MIKIGIIKQLNSEISNRIINNIKKYYDDYVVIESDALETTWYIHLCYKCFLK